MGENIISQFVLLGFSGLLLWAALTDIQSLTIPNKISGAVAALWVSHGAVLLLSGVPVGTVLSGPGAGLLALIGGAVLFQLRLVGGGDVKLLAASAMWAGPSRLLPLIMTVLLAGGVLALVMLAARSGQVFFGKVVTSGPVGPSGSGDHPFKTMMGTKIPFGVAIAAGGLMVAFRLAGL